MLVSQMISGTCTSSTVAAKVAGPLPLIFVVCVCTLVLLPERVSVRGGPSLLGDLLIVLRLGEDLTGAVLLHRDEPTSTRSCGSLRAAPPLPVLGRGLRGTRAPPKLS